MLGVRVEVEQEREVIAVLAQDRLEGGYGGRGEKMGVFRDTGALRGRARGMGGG